jgi:hypothetical protein
MRGDEARVARDFAGWLSSQEWTVRTEVDFVDIMAEKDDHRLYVEVKGAATEPGMDVDTAIGQLVRRMPSEPDQSVSFALVVRDGSGLVCPSRHEGSSDSTEAPTGRPLADRPGTVLGIELCSSNNGRCPMGMLDKAFKSGAAIKAIQVVKREASKPENQRPGIGYQATSEAPLTLSCPARIPEVVRSGLRRRVTVRGRPSRRSTPSCRW